MELTKAVSRAKPDLVRRAIASLALGMMVLVGAGVAAGLALIDGSDETVESLREVVSAVASESTEVTNLYLGEAESTARTAALTMQDGNAIDSSEVELTFRNLVAAHANIDGAFVAIPRGDFFFVTQSAVATDSGFRIKSIEYDAGTRRVQEDQVDTDFQLLSRIELPDDDFDPLTRPWYQSALETPQGWTEPYVFSSSGQPGITHYQAVRSDDGELIAVVGVDVRLTALNDFLTERNPSDGGQAIILNDQGRVVAGSHDAAIAADHLQRLTTLAMPTDPNVIDVTDWSVDEQVHVAALARVGGQDEWTLAVTVPEGDFLTGFAAQTDRVRMLLPLIGLFVIFGVAMLAMSTWQRVKRLNHKAESDPLTGIYDRNAVRDRLAAHLDDRDGRRLAAVSIDLDDFGQINDLWGHDVGDEVLKFFSARLIDAIGTNGFAGRLGGDEFLAVVELADDADVVAEVSALTDTICNEPIQVDDSCVPLGISCGIAVRERGELVGVVPLLRQSDLALLTAKTKKPRVALYSPNMALPSLRDAERSDELRRAIEAGQFTFHFQPEVDLGTGDVVGAEALMRWHKDDELLPVVADLFIADLERLDLVDMLTGDLVNSTSTLAAGLGGSEFTMRLNLSARQLRNHRTLDMIYQAAQQYPNVSWCIEITERTIMQTDSFTLKKLHTLVAGGLQLALDDFGTGYSSLAELVNLPVTTIKIDRSFTAALDAETADASLASLVTDMADRLSLHVVAEGIERQEQWEALAHIGCTRGQGFLFGEAMPIADFLSLDQLSVSRCVLS